eukprot:3160967-Rhodomonas_salina.1
MKSRVECRESKGAEVGLSVERGRGGRVEGRERGEEAALRSLSPSLDLSLSCLANAPFFDSSRSSCPLPLPSSSVSPFLLPSSPYPSLLPWLRLETGMGCRVEGREREGRQG